MMTSSRWPRFIVHFVNDHIEFRIPELESVVRAVKTQIRYVTDYRHENPFLLVDLPSEAAARRISGRAVLIRSVYRYWTHSNDLKTMTENILKLNPDFLKPFRRSDITVKCVISAYNKKNSGEEKLKKITALMDALNTDGSVQLENPDHRIDLLEYYSADSRQLEQVYVGNWLADGQRDLARRYNLQDRCFIGNTSMDPALSLIMANMANVQPADLVMDPFVGTGSLLVSCAHYGAYVMGMDIDYMLLHARARPSRVGQKVRAKDESVRNNLLQYDMASQCLDVMVADSSRLDMFRQDLVLDAIVTDPPYGIRESSIRVGGDGDQLKGLSEEEKEQRIPGKEKYSLSRVFTDLMVFAAKFLKLGGRLVYWLPVNREKYTDASLPGHVCLSVVHNCEQPITKRIGRRLVTVEKVREFQEGGAVESPEMRAHLDSFRQDCFLPREGEKVKRSCRAKLEAGANR